MLVLNSIVCVLDHYTEMSVLDSIVSILNWQAQDELQGKLLDKQRCVTHILHDASPKCVVQSLGETVGANGAPCAANWAGK